MLPHCIRTQVYLPCMLKYTRILLRYNQWIRGNSFAMAGISVYSAYSVAEYSSILNTMPQVRIRVRLELWTKNICRERWKSICTMKMACYLYVRFHGALSTLAKLQNMNGESVILSRKISGNLSKVSIYSTYFTSFDIINTDTVLIICSQ